MVSVMNFSELQLKSTPFVEDTENFKIALQEIF